MFHLKDLQDRFRVAPDSRLDLSERDPGWDGDDSVPKHRRKRFAEALLAEGIENLRDAQELLWAADTWSVLVVLQAMDAAGKDSTIKHVFSGVNPQGCRVASFKKPSAEELDHDFLWRCARELPRRGEVGIFNRSYYEEVLVVRVHPELLGYQRLPDPTPSPELWAARYDSINAFERHLVRNGTLVLKFFLHVSKEEQRQRFLDRLNEPDKRWKFSAADCAERRRWDDYVHAYEEAISATSTEWAPWYVVPADHKWVTRVVVAEVLGAGIRGLGLEYPRVSEEELAEQEEEKAALEAEGEEE